MTKRCPSCSRPLDDKHAERHARYLVRHRIHVKNTQRKYIREGKQCRQCGALLKGTTIRGTLRQGRCERCCTMSNKGQSRRRLNRIIEYDEWPNE